MFDHLLDINWQLVLIHLGKMGTAYVLALPIAWDRERVANSAGLRTFPLVSIATCGFMLIGIEVLDSAEAMARVMEGIITGMGFIGAGAILKGKDRVVGTATAASLWVASILAALGAIGLAVAWNRLEIAITLSIVTFLTLVIIGRAKHHNHSHNHNETPTD